MLNQLDELTKLKAMIFDTPEAELVKIQLIKDALAAGEYQINGRNISNKLLEYSTVLEEAEIV